MGLDITHEAWNGSYGSFHRYRTILAELAGLPPLDLMDGFYSEEYNNPLRLLNYNYPKGDEIEMYHVRRIFKNLPIKWECLKPNPLYEFLYHSDCDGYINWKSCGKIADELEKILLSFKEDERYNFPFRDKTEKLINGMRLAYNKKQKLKFQ